MAKEEAMLTGPRTFCKKTHHPALIDPCIMEEVLLLDIMNGPDTATLFAIIPLETQICCRNSLKRDFYLGSAGKAPAKNADHWFYFKFLQRNKADARGFKSILVSGSRFWRYDTTTSARQCCSGRRV